MWSLIPVKKVAGISEYSFLVKQMNKLFKQMSKFLLDFPVIFALARYLIIMYLTIIPRQMSQELKV